LKTSTAEYEQPLTLDDQVEQARKTIARLEEKLRVVDEELQGFIDQRQQHQLLNTICESLQQLNSLGGAHLFWREHVAPVDTDDFIRRVRGSASAFEEKIADIERRRSALRGDIDEEWLKVDLLNREIAELQEEEEARKYEFVVERELGDIPFRPTIMPWHQQAEDEKRFRKVLLLSLLLALMFGTLMSIWKLPIPEQAPVVEIPDRIVQLAKQAPPPPPVKLPEKQPEQTEEKAAEKPNPNAPKPTTAETKAARAKAEGSGILAFKNSFSELMDAAPGKLGVDAQVSNRGQAAVGTTQRALVVAQAEAGSGGISTASLSRDVGGGGNGKKLGGVTFTRVTSSIGTAGAAKGADRPLSSGPGPSRTDEEIQIVFDRYKATLYRIYNRELRNDPTLRGKMILRITIEPNGEVSACRIDSTDLASRALSAEIVDRVRKFNFGPKANVPRITILYPIDFLPATS
jgi:acetolactate synthase small subunit